MKGWKGCSMADKQHLLRQKLSNVQKSLTQQANRGATNCRRRIQGYMDELETVLVGPCKELFQKIDDEWLNEEKYQRQRSRVNWLKKGDCNTRFFHMTAMVRGQRNRISPLRLQRGGQADTKKEVQEEVIGYYKELFQKQPSLFIEEILATIDPLMQPEQNQALLAEVTRKR